MRGRGVDEDRADWVVERIHQLEVDCKEVGKGICFVVEICFEEVVVTW